MRSNNLLKIVRLPNLFHHDAKLTLKHIDLKIVLKIINEEHQLISKLQQLIVPSDFLLSMVTPQHLNVKLNLSYVN
jgi:hypothetical protein